MSLRIAFDIDGVLADMDAVARQHNSPQRFWKHVGATENFWEALGEVEPGCVARLAEASTAGRWARIVGSTQGSLTESGTFDSPNPAIC